MVFLPPRHSKSETVSRLFPAYCLSKYPEKWVGLCSYGIDLARTLSRNARANFVESGGTLAQSAKAVTHWETLAGGGMWAAGVGGAITGKGGHYLVIDDPVKNAEEAQSEVVLEKHRDWYDSTFYSRQEPNAAIVVVQTRWSDSDLSGWLLENEANEDPEGWYIVNLPAIAEEEREFPESCTVHPDWRKEGEALCPERYPIEKLLKILKRIAGYWWDALYQQRPTPRAGSFFHVDKFRIVEVAPAGLMECRAWDIAATEDGGAYTVGVKTAGPDSEGKFYVLDVVRGRWETGKRNAIIRQTAELDGIGCKVRLPQDPGAAGVDMANSFLRLLMGFWVLVERVTGKKESRADPMSAQINGGNYCLVRGDWNKEFINEYRQFPRGKYCDQVDAGADAFSELALQEIENEKVPIGMVSGDSSTEYNPFGMMS